MGNLSIKLILFGCAAGAVIVCCDGGNETKTGQRFSSTSKNSLTDDADIYKWTAPAEMSKNYLYYISGLDEDSRPIFVCEFGKWDVRRVLEKGGAEARDFEKYMDQGFHRFALGVNQTDLKAVGVRVAEGEEDVEVERRDGSILIVDMEGFNFLQVASPQTLRWMLSMAGKLSTVTEKLAYGYFINMNYVGERMMNLARPILGMGSTMERIEVYGTNPEKWIPRLFRMLPRNQLPPWYGGPKSFAPLVVYG